MEGDIMSIEAPAETTKALRNKYAVVGIGETEYLRVFFAGKTTRKLGRRKRSEKRFADAGLDPADVDGMRPISSDDSASRRDRQRCRKCV